MVISRGKVVFEYGDVALVSKIASVRKSILDLLFAVEAHKGLDLEKYMGQNVVQLGLEDKTPFNEMDRPVPGSFLCDGFGRPIHHRVPLL